MSEEKISRVTRLVVGRGRTSQPSETEWAKSYYELEAIIVDPADLEVMRANMLGLIDGWLSSKPTAVVATAPPPVETGTTQHIDYAEKRMAKMVQTQNKLTILPESLEIKADDPAIANFLKPRILDKMKEKHGLDYSVEEHQGLLQAIVIRGPLDAKQIEDLKNPIGWALSKASEPKAEKAAEPDVEAIKSKFPEGLASKLAFEVEGEFFVIKPREYLGSEAFARIATIVRGEGGSYISEGKNSRFKIPR